MNIRRVLPTLGILFTLGCSSTASFQQPHLQQIDLASSPRVIVLPLEGTPSLANTVRTELEEQLVRGGLFYVIPWRQHDDEVLAARKPGDTTIDELMRVARVAGADLAITGQITERADLGSNVGSINLVLGDPQLDVELTFQITSLITGEVIVDKDITKSYRGPISETDVEIGAPSSEEVLIDLATKCVGELASEMAAPASQTINVKLASAGFSSVSEEVAAGNQFAEKGNWYAAKAAYEEGLRKDHQHHAVLYNLGVANEALGELAEAEHCVRAALQQDDDASYLATLQRITKSQQAHKLFAARTPPKATPTSRGLADLASFERPIAQSDRTIPLSQTDYSKSNAPQKPSGNSSAFQLQLPSVAPTQYPSTGLHQRPIPESTNRAQAHTAIPLR